MWSFNPFEKNSQNHEQINPLAIQRMRSSIQSLITRVNCLEMKDSQNQSFRNLFSSFFQINPTSDVAESRNLLGKVSQQLRKINRGDCENQRLTDMQEKMSRLQNNLRNFEKKSNDQIQKLQETMNQIINKVNEMGNYLTPMIQSKQIEILLKKDRQEQQIRLKNQLENIKKVSKSNPKSLVQVSTAGFTFEHNIIKLGKQEKGTYFPSPQQVLFNTVIGKKHLFSFHTRIVTSEFFCLIVGIVDRKKQKHEKSSYLSPNVIAYHGGDGAIRYGQNGKSKEKQTTDCFQDAMGVLMQVNLLHSLVTFTLQTKTESKKFKVKSDILQQPNRQFVPYYEFYHKGDSVQWSII